MSREQDHQPLGWTETVSRFKFLGSLISDHLVRTHNSSRLQHRELSGGRNLSQHLFVSLHYCPIERVGDVLTAALQLTMRPCRE